MANEIKVTTYLKCTNSYFVDNWVPSEVSVNQSAIGAAGGVQTIGTSAEALGVADLVTVGYARFRNMDATNYVQIGPYVSGTFHPAIKLKPGDPATLRLDPTNPWYAKANTAAVKLQYMIFED